MFGSPIEGDFLATGTPLGSPPLIDMMSNDPILHDVKVTILNSFLQSPLTAMPNNLSSLHVELCHNVL